MTGPVAILPAFFCAKDLSFWHSSVSQLTRNSSPVSSLQAQQSSLLLPPSTRPARRPTGPSAIAPSVPQPALPRMLYLFSSVMCSTATRWSFRLTFRDLKKPSGISSVYLPNIEEEISAPLGRPPPITFMISPPTIDLDNMDIFAIALRISFSVRKTFDDETQGGAWKTPCAPLRSMPPLCEPAAELPADEARQTFMIDRAKKVFVRGGELAVR